MSTARAAQPSGGPKGAAPCGMSEADALTNIGHGALKEAENEHGAAERRQRMSIGGEN